MYKYKTKIIEHSNRQVEVQMWVDYKMYTDREYIKAPENKKTKYFHYSLNLNDRGQVIGGSFYRDSSQLDLLWVTHKPMQGGSKGNKRGNPHMKVEKVIQLWRDSVDEEAHKWVNIDPIGGQRKMDLAAKVKREAELAAKAKREAELAARQAAAAAAIAAEETTTSTGVGTVAVDGDGNE